MKNWINEDAFVIGDTHFGHKNIIVYEPIRRSIVDETKITADSTFSLSEEKIIENWNATVNPEDHVLHLGDFVLGGTKKITEYAKKLNGHIHLIMGNHDSGSNAAYKNNNIDIINDIYVYDDDLTIIKRNRYSAAIIAQINDKTIMFSHVPIIKDTRYGDQYSQPVKELYDIFERFKCDINVHGHIHSNINQNETDESPLCVNASIEAINFKPIKIKQLI